MASVKLGDLELAVEFVSAADPVDHAAYIAISTGRIYWKGDFTGAESLPDDIEDEEKYIAIPTKADLGLGKSMPLKFAREYIPQEYDEVRAMFNRSGGYRSFKSMLERRNLNGEWHAFESAEEQSAICEWCEENGIAIER